MSRYENYDRERASEDKAYKDFDRHSRRAGIRIFGLSLAAVIAIIVIIVLVAVIGWFLAPWKGAKEQRDTVFGDGDYRIAAYERFYDDCAAIQALEDRIALLEDDKSIPDEMKGLQALRAERATLIRQYNANARKEGTLANFKASDLPYEIDPEGTTTCTV